MGLGQVLHHGVRLWAPCTRARRYHAALAMLLTAHRYSRLESQAKGRVDDEIVQVFKPYGIYPWWRFRTGARSTAMAAERAVAMYRLGLQTGVSALSWEDILHPWHRQFPAQLIQDFDARHPATEEAIRFLEGHGLPRDEMERFGTIGLPKASAAAAHDG